MKLEIIDLVKVKNEFKFDIIIEESSFFNK